MQERAASSSDRVQLLFNLFVPKDTPSDSNKGAGGGVRMPAARFVHKFCMGAQHRWFVCGAILRCAWSAVTEHCSFPPVACSPTC
mmetsp:Transcript_28366/g.53218  ORF Transcript_28366/g.53218 Transcript_28366/m.53218 type:complete len:85 (-) Transcript_28366:499-753(-)